MNFLPFLVQRAFCKTDKQNGFFVTSTCLQIEHLKICLCIKSVYMHTLLNFRQEIPNP